MFWTELYSAMTVKLLRGHGWNYQVGSTTRNLKETHIWLMVPIFPIEDPPPQNTLLSCMFLSIVGWYPVLTRSGFQSFSEVPSQHTRAELRARLREPFNPAQPQWICRKTPGRSHLFVWLAGLPGSLDVTVSLSLLRFKCASPLGPDLFQISGVVCNPLAFESLFLEYSKPTQPWWRTHHSSSG